MTAATRSEKLEEVQVLASRLSDAQLEDVLKQIRWVILMAEAKRLDESILPNDITMDEIVEEVNQVRKERYEAQQNSH